MGMFTNVGDILPSIEESFSDPNMVMNIFILDEVSQLPDEKIKEFCAPGGVGEQLCEAGKFKKNTLVRLSKKDDLARRETMVAMQLAKENNDPLWKKFVINTQRRNELKAQIKKKYSTKASRVARQGQQEFLHGGPKKKGILPKNFQRFGGDDRLSNDD